VNRIKSVLRAVFRPPIRRLEGDDFIKRLPSAVVGAAMLHEGNPYLFDWAIRNMPEQGAVVEIGSYGGLSTNLLVHMMRKHRRNASFFTCDAWVYEGFHDITNGATPWMDGNTNVSRVDFMAHIKASYIQVTRLFSNDQLPYTIHTRSDIFLEQWASEASCSDVFGRMATLGGPIAFAYLDGDHSLQTVQMEFEAINKYLLPGGFILLDDSGRGMPFGSVQVADAILQRDDYQLVARNPNVLVQKCK
jgi:Methyltransferase domain